MSKQELPKNIDEYISGFPDNVQEILNTIRKIIHSKVDGLEETMGYGIPTFKLNGKNFIHFGAYKSHIGLYPAPSAITSFEDKLKNYKHAKGSIRLPLNESIPYDLIEEIVEFRVKEER